MYKRGINIFRVTCIIIQMGNTSSDTSSLYSNTVRSKLCECHQIKFRTKCLFPPSCCHPPPGFQFYFLQAPHLQKNTCFCYNRHLNGHSPICCQTLASLSKVSLSGTNFNLPHVARKRNKECTLLPLHCISPLFYITCKFPSCQAVMGWSPVGWP